MPVTWTSQGNCSTGRPGSGSADRPGAAPGCEPSPVAAGKPLVDRVLVADGQAKAHEHLYRWCFLTVSARRWVLTAGTGSLKRHGHLTAEVMRAVRDFISEWLTRPGLPPRHGPQVHLPPDL